MKKTIFVFLSVLFLFSSCEKQEDFTQQIPTGENTAYFYVDGVLNVPEGRSNFPYRNLKPISFGGCESPSKTLEMYITGLNFDLDILLLNGFSTVAEYRLTHGGSICFSAYNNGYFASRDKNGIWGYYYCENNSGTINIETMSADKRKFTGSFQMEVYAATGEVKHITNGHFNINLDSL